MNKRPQRLRTSPASWLLSGAYGFEGWMVSDRTALRTHASHLPGPANLKTTQEIQFVSRCLNKICQLDAVCSLFIKWFEVFNEFAVKLWGLGKVQPPWSRFNCEQKKKKKNRKKEEESSPMWSVKLILAFVVSGLITVAAGMLLLTECLKWYECEGYSNAEKKIRICIQQGPLIVNRVWRGRGMRSRKPSPKSERQCQRKLTFVKSFPRSVVVVIIDDTKSLTTILWKNTTPFRPLLENWMASNTAAQNSQNPLVFSCEFLFVFPSDQITVILGVSRRWPIVVSVFHNCEKRFLAKKKPSNWRGFLVKISKMIVSIFFSSYPAHQYYNAWQSTNVHRKATHCSWTAARQAHEKTLISGWDRESATIMWCGNTFVPECFLNKSSSSGRNSGLRGR